MFCTECGSPLSGAFCSQCGKQASALPSGGQIVKCEILTYVEEEWANDFADFIDEARDTFRNAKLILQSPKTPVSPEVMADLEAVFGDFLEGGGFDRSMTFASVDEFLRTVD